MFLQQNSDQIPPRTFPATHRARKAGKTSARGELLWIRQIRMRRRDVFIFKIPGGKTDMKQTDST